MLKQGEGVGDRKLGFFLLLQKGMGSKGGVWGLKEGLGRKVL